MLSLRELSLGLVLAASCQALGVNDLLQQVPLVGNAANKESIEGSPSSTAPNSSKQPNILFVLTDDQDLHMNSLDYIPFVKKHLLDKGTLYKRHFCTTALCCPSRATLWTGKATHNTNITDVNPPHGGYPKFVSQGLNETYLPIWLQSAGYNTYYTGKLFNAHTIYNYNAPFVSGWTGSDFLLDPYTYDYLNSTYQRNHDPPKSYEGRHTVDVLSEKAYGFLDDAVHGDKPFFLAVAPVAPHSNIVGRVLDYEDGQPPDLSKTKLRATPPIPAKRHEHLFPGLKVPRTENFNPDEPSGAGWIKDLPQLSEANVEYNDHFYRQRLRALQSVDELVDGLFTRLEEYGVLDNTYIFYTTDNGYHLSQHRLQPGKECGFEEDINIPLIIRGPGVPHGKETDVVTTHTDLVPTILGLTASGLDTKPASFVLDGEKVPLTAESLDSAAAKGGRHEHVTVEYWGFAASEGLPFEDQMYWFNNTYKALRVVGEEWNLYYSVWCHGEHELYDLKTDPGQLHNLLHTTPFSPSPTIQGVPLSKLVSRLDSLLFVTKSCTGETCTRPWRALHPAGNVDSLASALAPRFDVFYEHEQKRVSFDRCEMGYIRDAEGPQFEEDGVAFGVDGKGQRFYGRGDGLKWSEWT